MILLTGAGGRTGRAVLAALVTRGADVRAFIRNAGQADDLRALGATDVVLGDMLQRPSVEAAVEGCHVVLHIGPPMHEDEVSITETFLTSAKRFGAERFIYYSVMHPFRRDVRHHALKLDATELIVESEVPYTLIEPCRYMQHLEPIWASVVESGIHAMPFNTRVRFSVVDLLDLAEAAAKVATEPGHEYATYELAGPQPLSQDQMAAIITDVIGRPVRAEQVPLEVMSANGQAKGLSDDRIEQMWRMNRHYDTHGFPGNPNVLQWLLGRSATTYTEYVQRLASR